jgi:hypothetical protein
LTRDYTVAQAMADHGLVSERQVVPHRLQHMLTQAIGIRGVRAEPEYGASDWPTAIDFCSAPMA